MLLSNKSSVLCINDKEEKNRDNWIRAVLGHEDSVDDHDGGSEEAMDSVSFDKLTYRYWVATRRLSSNSGGMNDC